MTSPWKTTLSRTLAVVSGLVILAASFYAEENWRGVKAWTECQRELEAKGENLDWTNYIPAPVPNDQNFFKAPMMTEWFVKDRGTNHSDNLGTRLVNPETTSPLTNEVQAANYLAWSDTFEPDFDKIRGALRRPYFRMDGNYQEPFERPIPNFVAVRALAQTLAQRARCHLLLGEPDKALDDLTLMHDFMRMLYSDSNKDSPVLVSGMIYVAVAGLYANVVADGTTLRAWQEPQLAAIQKQLQDFNLLQVLAASLRTERAAVCDAIEKENLPDISSTRTVSDFGWSLIPSGWLYQNMAVVATLEQKPLDCFDFTNNVLWPYKVEAAYVSADQTLQHVTPWNYFAAICIPSFKKAIEATARNQSWLDQAQIACALERCRLANGKYPDTLAKLTPQFIGTLPHDVIGGKPLIYSCKDGQTFRLYSIGWNEADDGGITIFSSGYEDREQGDWVWQYPAK